MQALRRVDKAFLLAEPVDLPEAGGSHLPRSKSGPGRH